MKKQTTPQELVFGIHPLLELLRAKKRKIYVIYTTKPVPKAWSDIEVLLPARTQIQYVSRDALTSMCDSSDHQGVAAWAAPFQYRKKFFTPEREKMLLMLDGVQDPRNLGAILRSAYCTGVQGVIIIKQKASPLTAIALKASAGLAEYLEVYQAPSSSAAIVELQQAGYSVYLAALGGKNLPDVTFQLPLCLVIGSEGTGISKEILKSGTKVMLAQKEAEISYNASVAAGILLFYIATQQKLV